jgi:hypothetical protein
MGFGFGEGGGLLSLLVKGQPLFRRVLEALAAAAAKFGVFRIGEAGRL